MAGIDDSSVTMPRLVIGAEALSVVGGELACLGVSRPLLLSHRGIKRAGAVAAALRALPGTSAPFLDVPEKPTLAGADAAFAGLVCRHPRRHLPQRRPT